MSLSPGVRLGAYEIVALVGAGGMGEIYRARDTRLDRMVAIKILAAPLAADPELRDRFDREARAISSLNHPHICTLFDVGHQDGVDFLVLEYLEGETLAERLARGGEGRPRSERGPEDRASTSATRSTKRIARASSIAISSRRTFSSS